ncbi:uncharacterized protein LOC114737356 isoform X1 [Neltuma alba]|uniref:uncharacterized protein LOC114737356 isoform X1 n=1 Tax=Neltuma alba TaxID=207710 RepID=UPI0010A4ACD4|nr:uncharacterized protein LOC114737356 isoform X1 [Prosopis alba]
MTWHSDYMLPRVKATPCGAFSFLVPQTLTPSHSSSLLSFPLATDQRRFLSRSSSPKFLVLSTFIVSLHMERNRRRSYQPHLSSYEPRDRCSTELTQAGSASSAICMDTCGDISRHSAAPFPLDDLTRWTDWQHNSYLNSLEASFVNEMYHSAHLLGCQSVQNDSNEVDKSITSQKLCNMSGQFIPQDGFWKKVSHERNEPMLESTGDSHVLAGGPLKFTSAERGCAVRDFAVHHSGLLCDEGRRRGKSIFSGRSPRSSAEQHDPCNPESVATTAVLVEFTDQNFKDEDQGAPSSCVPIDERLKTASADDASRHDHVVPIEKFYSTFR